MGLKAAFHALMQALSAYVLSQPCDGRPLTVYAASTHFQSPMNGRGIEASFKQLGNLSLHLHRLFPGAWHRVTTTTILIRERKAQRRSDWDGRVAPESGDMRVELLESGGKSRVAARARPQDCGKCRTNG